MAGGTPGLSAVRGGVESHARFRHFGRRDEDGDVVGQGGPTLKVKGE